MPALGSVALLKFQPGKADFSGLPTEPLGASWTALDKTRLPKLGEKYFLERVKVILLTTQRKKGGFNRKSWRAKSGDLGLDKGLADTYYTWIDHDKDDFISYKDIQDFLEREHSPRFAVKRAFMKNLDDPQLFQQERTWECPWAEPPLSLEQGLLGTGLYVAEICYTEPKVKTSPRKKRYIPGSPRRRKKRKPNLRLFKTSGFSIPPQTQTSGSFSRTSGDVTTFHHAVPGMPPFLSRSHSAGSVVSATSVSATSAGGGVRPHLQLSPPHLQLSPPHPEAGAAPSDEERTQGGRAGATAFPFDDELIPPTKQRPFDATPGGGAVPEDDAYRVGGPDDGRPFTPPSPFTPPYGDGPLPPSPRSRGFGRTLSHPFLPRALSFSERKDEGLSPTERKILSTLLRRVPPGSLLTHVNDLQVEHATLIELLEIITKARPPYTLRFQLQRPDHELQDNIPPQLRFEANHERGGMLKNTDLNCWEKEHVLYEYTAPVDKNKAALESQFFSHCQHCPLKDAWYLPLHLTMEDESYSTLSFLITTVVFLLIGISTVAFILETVPSLEGPIWVVLEWTVSLIFTFEYVTRFCVSREYWPYYIDPMNLIDFFSILPFWLELFMSAANLEDVIDVSFLRVIRITRLARIFRLLKDPRFDNISQFGVILARTLSASLFAFYTLISIVVLLVIIFASVVYTIEMGTLEWIATCGQFDRNFACSFPPEAVLNGTAQCEAACLTECGEKLIEFYDPKDGCCEWIPSTGGCHYWPHSSREADTSDTQMAATCLAEKIRSRNSEKGVGQASPFVDIAEAMWWSTVTMFMVGYGEISPTSWVSQCVNIFCMLIGLLVLAAPVIIMGFEYAVAMQRSYVIQAEKTMIKGNDNWRKKMDELNACLGFNYFDRDSELAAVKNGVPSTSRFQQFVGTAYNHGWAYLPFESSYVPSTPRLNQWQNFILHEYYGRKYADVEKRRAVLSRWASALGLSHEDRKMVDAYITYAPKRLPPELYDPLKNTGARSAGSTTKGGPDPKEDPKSTATSRTGTARENTASGTVSGDQSTRSFPEALRMELYPSPEAQERRESGSFWIERHTSETRARKSETRESQEPLFNSGWPDSGLPELNWEEHSGKFRPNNRESGYFGFSLGDQRPSQEFNNGRLQPPQLEISVDESTGQPSVQELGPADFPFSQFPDWGRPL